MTDQPQVTWLEHHVSREDRDAVRAMLAEHGRPDDFAEVYVKAPLERCESRDPKGLYKQARAGKISNFTGIDDPCEPPRNPALTIDSSDTPPKKFGRASYRIPADCWSYRFHGE